jgi:hypothetical protein
MAANPERGEVDITVDGKTYTLKLSMNAAATLQGRTKKTIGTLMDEATALDFVAIRSIVWLLLQKHHAADFKTEDKVGEFMDDAGGVAPFFDALQTLGKANSAGPDPNATAQETNGTGANSTSVPGGSA